MPDLETTQEAIVRAFAQRLAWRLELDDVVTVVTPVAPSGTRDQAAYTFEVVDGTNGARYHVDITAALVATEDTERRTR
jgi:hypothetical protein